MCEAVREFFKDEFAAGEALSRAKGREEGREEGRAEGREEGRAESLINNVLNAYRKGWQIVDIADFLGISEEQVKEIYLITETLLEVLIKVLTKVLAFPECQDLAKKI